MAAMDISRLIDGFRLPEAIPLMQKAVEIRELVDHILKAAPDPGKGKKHGGGDDLADEEEPENISLALQQQMEEMHLNSMLIPAKIVGAEGGDIYDLRMENATLIRKAARELVVGLRGLEIFGYDEQPYFNLLREEMEEFRMLFIAWVQAFDIKRFIADDWGLFNPPGVNPGDDTIGDLGDDEDDDEDDNPYDD